VKAGDLAPDFAAPAHTGELFRLYPALAEGPVVLFFYPKAFSAGCTIEVGYFQARIEEFRARGARLAGISRDSLETQARFAAGCSADFPLLSDADGRISRLFGLKRWAGLPAQRATFVIAPDGRVTRVIRAALNMRAHADGALRALANGQPAKNSLSGAQ
jgi:peroxiredoxin Q/BCP